MTDYKATPEQWQEDAARWLDAILELRARVEALEGKYETQRLATLEWGEDVDKVKRWSDQHLQRIMKLEAAQPIDEEENDRRFHACMDLIRNATPEQIRAAAGLPERKTSKVYEINEPLQLTPEQAQQLMDLLTPNSKPAVKGPLLITRVAAAISQDGESINWSGAYAAIREVATWLRDEQAYGVCALLLEQEAGQ
jgi:hypothetical protein